MVGNECAATYPVAGRIGAGHRSLGRWLRRPRDRAEPQERETYTELGGITGLSRSLNADGLIGLGLITASGSPQQRRYWITGPHTAWEGLWIGLETENDSK